MTELFPGPRSRRTPEFSDPNSPRIDTMFFILGGLLAEKVVDPDANGVVQRGINQVRRLFQEENRKYEVAARAAELLGGGLLAADKAKATVTEWAHFVVDQVNRSTEEPDRVGPADGFVYPPGFEDGGEALAFLKVTPDDVVQADIPTDQAA